MYRIYWITPEGTVERAVVRDHRGTREQVRYLLDTLPEDTPIFIYTCLNECWLHKYVARDGQILLMTKKPEGIPPAILTFHLLTY